MTGADENLTFMDLSGNEISNPQKTIREMNRRQTRKKIDYQAFHPATKIGIAELWGRRAAQEDRVVAGTLFDFAKLNEPDRMFVLEHTILILQNIITELNLGDQGSTLCSTVILGDQVYTSNLGDGTAFLCTVDAQGAALFELLNTRHNPYEPGEAKRLRRASKLVIGNRLAGMLALSRALGDNDFEQHGLIHAPEILHHQAKIPKQGEAFIINACDGLTECDDGDWQQRIDLLQKVLQANYQKPNYEIALQLSLAALNADFSTQIPNVKVGDNISVMVAKINPKAKEAIYMLVCDGHGGDEVSEAAATLYDAVLKNQILLALLKKSDSKFVELIEGVLHSNSEEKGLFEIKKLYQDYNAMLAKKLETV